MSNTVDELREDAARVFEKFDHRVSTLENHRDQHRGMINDLRTEVEQLQAAHADAAMGGIASALEPTIERYARVNIKKNAKGEYQHETTVTVTMTGGHWVDVKQQLFEGLRMADEAARAEIDQRTARDQDPSDSDDLNLSPF